MRNVSKVLAIIILLVLGFCAQTTIAQDKTLSNDPDPRLYEAFGKERIDFLMKNNPDLIGYYNFFLDNAFILVKYPQSKLPGIISNVPLLQVKNSSFSMDIPDMEKGTKGVNILKYEFQISQEKATQYRLDDSGILVVVYSTTAITEKYNKARNL